MKTLMIVLPVLLTIAGVVYSVFWWDVVCVMCEMHGLGLYML
jgi:hypothetical protein